MLSYRHAYHAGNLGDVLKHPLLCLLLRALQKKPKPLFYLDTHAGTGRYDLMTAEAQKNQEFLQGAVRLWQARRAPPELQPYLQCLRILNPGDDARLRYYPGSPWLASKILRPDDRLLLRDMNRNDCNALRALFKHDRRVTVEVGDGYQALRAHLPPRERRGLVLIDPSYENPGEFDAIVKHLQFAVKRWAGGVYVVWYPLMARYPVAGFLRQMAESGIPKIYVAELSAYPSDNPVGLNGSGMLIVNPPYQFDVSASTLTAWLWQTLALGQGGYRNEWLTADSSRSDAEDSLDYGTDKDA